MERVTPSDAPLHFSPYSTPSTAMLRLTRNVDDMVGVSEPTVLVASLGSSAFSSTACSSFMSGFWKPASC